MQKAVIEPGKDARRQLYIQPRRQSYMQVVYAGKESYTQTRKQLHRHVIIDTDSHTDRQSHSRNIDKLAAIQPDRQTGR